MGDTVVPSEVSFPSKDRPEGVSPRGSDHVNGRVFHAIFEMGQEKGQIYMIGYYRPVVERSREMDRLKQ